MNDNKKKYIRKDKVKTLSIPLIYDEIAKNCILFRSSSTFKLLNYSEYIRQLIEEDWERIKKNVNNS